MLLLLTGAEVWSGFGYTVVKFLLGIFRQMAVW
jgi:hypothetical protein